MKTAELKDYKFKNRFGEDAGALLEFFEANKAETVTAKHFDDRVKDFQRDICNKRRLNQYQG